MTEWNVKLNDLIKYDIHDITNCLRFRLNEFDQCRPQETYVFGWHVNQCLAEIENERSIRIIVKVKRRRWLQGVSTTFLSSTFDRFLNVERVWGLIDRHRQPAEPCFNPLTSACTRSSGQLWRHNTAGAPVAYVNSSRPHAKKTLFDRALIVRPPLKFVCIGSLL